MLSSTTTLLGAVCIWCCIVAPNSLYAQSSLLRKKIEYSSSIGKNFILEFCDSNITGRFIGSPLYRNTELLEIFPQPRLDGRIIGTLNNGLWEGYWHDDMYKGKFAVQFSDNYSSYKGAFYRTYQGFDPIAWETISGSQRDEVWTLEGKRSPVIAGVASLFASGAGHWYNREYEKANLYSIIDISLLTIGGAAALHILGDFFYTTYSLINNSPLPTSSYTPTAINVARFALAGAVGIRIAAIIDAIISAQKINTALDAQPLPLCETKLPVTEEIAELDTNYRAAFLTPSQSINSPPLWRVSRSTVFIELGGTGVLGSVNYEHLVTDWLGLRAGFVSDLRTVTIVPMTANFLIGSSIEHKLELGIGVSTVITPDAMPVPLWTGGIGYRYHPALSGFLFRAAFTPLYGSAIQGGILPWGGISVGYTL